MNVNIMTPQEVAEYLHISISELRKLMTNREISYFEVGEASSKKKAKRFMKKDVLAFIDKNYYRSKGDESQWQEKEK